MGINTEFILARDKLRTLPVPRFLSPIETRRQFLLSLLIFGVPALGIGIAILWQRGLGEPSSTGDLIFTIVIAALAGVAEEVLFGGLAKRYFGNGGLVVGRIIWVILHIFYAPVKTFYRIPMDILFGILYIKLWRGRYWWLSLIIHPLWNVTVIVGWQLAKVYIS